MAIEGLSWSFDKENGRVLLEIRMEGPIHAIPLEMEVWEAKAFHEILGRALMGYHSDEIDKAENVERFGHKVWFLENGEQPAGDS